MVGCVKVAEGMGIRTEPLLTLTPFAKLNPGDCVAVSWEMTNHSGNRWVYFPDISPDEWYLGGWGYFTSEAIAVTPDVELPKIIHDEAVVPAQILCWVIGQGNYVGFRIAPHPSTIRYRVLRPPYEAIPVVRVERGVDGNTWYFGVIEDNDWLFGWIPADQVAPLGNACPSP